MTLVHGARAGLPPERRPRYDGRRASARRAASRRSRRCRTVLQPRRRPRSAGGRTRAAFRAALDIRRTGAARCGPPATLLSLRTAPLSFHRPPAAPFVIFVTRLLETGAPFVRCHKVRGSKQELMTRGRRSSLSERNSNGLRMPATYTQLQGAEAEESSSGRPEPHTARRRGDKRRRKRRGLGRADVEAPADAGALPAAGGRGTARRRTRAGRGLRRHGPSARAPHPAPR